MKFSFACLLSIFFPFQFGLFEPGTSVFSEAHSFGLNAYPLGRLNAEWITNLGQTFTKLLAKMKTPFIFASSDFVLSFIGIEILGNDV